MIPLLSGRTQTWELSGERRQPRVSLASVNIALHHHHHHQKKGLSLPSRLLAVLRVCRVCSHHCMKVSFWLLLIPWNNFSSFSSSSTFLLARPLVELLQESIEEAEDRQCCVRLMEVLLFFSPPSFSRSSVMAFKLYT